MRNSYNSLIIKTFKMRKCEIENKLHTKLNLKFTSESTVRSYLNAYRKFSRDFSNLDRLTQSNIEDYLITFKESYSPSYYNQVVSMLKILYSEVFRQPRKVKGIKLLKQPDTLSDVLSVNQVEQSISKLKNLKHKVIIYTLYITGLRLSELLNLKIEHINSDLGLIHVVKGKGLKDRYVPITEDLLMLLREYYKIYRPVTYLFNGQGGGKYSASSVRKICKRVGINNPHLLRHSIITHLIDSGDQQTKVQMFAGHASAKSTLKYYHMAPSSLNSLSLPTL